MVKIRAYRYKNAIYISILLDSTDDVTPITKAEQLEGLKHFLDQDQRDKKLYRVKEPIHLWIREP